MTAARGRIVRGSAAAAATPLVTNLHDRLRGRVSRDERGARARAAEIVANAEREARAVRDQAAAEGRAEGFAETTALAVKLREHAAARESDAAQDAVELARVLAERLVGHALATDPGTVAHLARTALSEARGTRRIVIVANAADADVLRPVLGALDAEGRLSDVRVDPSLGPGDLRLETDAGTLDARVGPALDRLTARLSEALRR